MDNKKNIILLVIGIVLAALICVGLISLLTDGGSDVTPTGESTLATTDTVAETEDVEATEASTQQTTGGDVEIDQTVDPEEKPIDGTIGNTGHEGDTGNKDTDPTVPSENDSDITVDLQPEPTQGEGSTGTETEPTESGDSKIEIDFNDF